MKTSIIDLKNIEEDDRFFIDTAYFSYCGLDDECQRSRIIDRTKKPFKLSVHTKVDKKFIGENIEITFFLTARGVEEPLWEHYWTTELQYENQQSNYKFDDFPDDLSRVDSSKYRRITLTVEAISDVSEKFGDARIPRISFNY